MDKRYRNYCFTLNNYTNEEIKQLQEKELKEIKYIIVGGEIASTGTPHLQGFIIWRNAKTLKASIKCLPKRSHVEICKGTPYDNFLYCKKDGNVVWEVGDRPEKVGQGKRKDLSKIKETLASQKTSIKQMLDSNDIVNHQQLKYAESLQKYYEPKRKTKPIVEWYYGATGTGKTQRAYDRMEELAKDDDNIYEAMDTGRWWDGYDGQEYIIIDDMRGDFLKFHQLLKLLDRYSYRVETKGSTRQFLGKHIIITSAYPPHRLFQTREDIEQLLRRIDVVCEFRDGEQPQIKKIEVEKKKYLCNI